MKAPTIQQLTSYKLGEDGLRVKLNPEGSDFNRKYENINGFRNMFTVSAIDFENNVIELRSTCSLSFKLKDVGLKWIELQLKPLSLLKSEIDYKGEKFIPVEWLEDKYYTLDLHKQCERLLDEDGENWINHNEFMLVEHLIEWEFDIYGLND